MFLLTHDVPDASKNVHWFFSLIIGRFSSFMSSQFCALDPVMLFWYLVWVCFGLLMFVVDFDFEPDPRLFIHCLFGANGQTARKKKHQGIQRSGAPEAVSTRE
jgi:hypothetical protein